MVNTTVAVLPPLQRWYMKWSLRSSQEEMIHSPICSLTFLISAVFLQEPEHRLDALRRSLPTCETRDTPVVKPVNIRIPGRIDGTLLVRAAAMLDADIMTQDSVAGAKPECPDSDQRFHGCGLILCSLGLTRRSQSVSITNNPWSPSEATSPHQSQGTLK